MNKNEKLELKLPTSQWYTLDDVFNSNPQFPHRITARVRHTNAIIAGKTVEIGCILGGKGRPQKVYALTPVSKLVLDAAEAKGINLVEKAREKLILVVSMKTSTVSPVTPKAILTVMH